MEGSREEGTGQIEGRGHSEGAHSERGHSERKEPFGEAVTEAGGIPTQKPAFQGIGLLKGETKKRVSQFWYLSISRSLGREAQLDCMPVDAPIVVVKVDGDAVTQNGPVGL